MVGQECVLLKYLYLNSKLNSFPGRFMNHQIFELSSSFVANSDEKLGREGGQFASMYSSEVSRVQIPYQKPNNRTFIPPSLF